MADVMVVNHGSLCMVTPLTQEAKDWLAENLSDEVTIFGDSVAVEPRYVEDLVAGMQGDGLEVE